MNSSHSFEHRKRQGMCDPSRNPMGIVAPGVLQRCPSCQIHLEMELTKDQLLETGTESARSGTPIATARPIPKDLPPHPFECRAKPDGVRAVAADRSVDPKGDEPQGATIQTEPMTRLAPCRGSFRTRLLFTMSTEQADTRDTSQGCKPFLLRLDDELGSGGACPSASQRQRREDG